MFYHLVKRQIFCLADQGACFHLIHNDLVRRVYYYGSEDYRSQYSRQFIANSHDADPLGGTLKRTYYGYERISRGLEDGHSGAHGEQSQEEHVVRTPECGRNEQEGTQRQEPQSVLDTSLESGFP